MSSVSFLKKNKTKGCALLKGKKYIDYKDVRLLLYFTDRFGRIKSRRYTCCTIEEQKKVANAVKNARIMGLLSFVKHGA